MKKLRFIYMILLLLFCLVLEKEALSWTEETHKDLSRIASENSILSTNKGNYLKNLGFDKELLEELKWNETKRTVRNWIREGAELEDKGDPLFPVLGTTRSVNHFHNPLKLWDQAGLDDWVAVLHYTGESSLFWAQDGENQLNYPEKDWSWQKIRNYYYLALTPATESERQANFAKTFRGLGHQMHLIQDGAQPDHVRNNAHPWDTTGLKRWIGIEKWADKNPSIVNSLASEPFSPQVPLNISYNHLAPITQLFDTLQYYNGVNPSASLAQGLSEYTNANFFSDDTIFAAEVYDVSHRHYFPYPKRSSTDLDNYLAWNKLPETVVGEDNIPDTGFWIKKIADGEGEGAVENHIKHFLKPTYLTNDIGGFLGTGALYYRSFYQDEKCHEDYARHLIPRAVGYSAGLLQYFFRGELHIEALLPSVDQVPFACGTSYCYSSRNEMGSDIKTVAVLVQNNSKLNDAIEVIGKGTLTLTIGYTGTTSGAAVYQTAGTFSITEIPAVGSGYLLPLLFSLSQPIPTEKVKDLTYYLVFRGKLGQEEDAVIGKVVRAPVLYSASPDEGIEGTVVTLAGDNLPDPGDPQNSGIKVVDFLRDRTKPYDLELINPTVTQITVKVPNTAGVSKPGYGGIRVINDQGGSELIWSNPVDFFPIAEGEILNTGSTPVNVTIEAVKPIVGDYDELPRPISYPVLARDSLSIQLMTGFTYHVTGGTTDTMVDISDITPDSNDFVIGVK